MGQVYLTPPGLRNGAGDDVPDWRSQGAPCAGEPIHVFYPDKGQNVAPEIKKMCRERCPVRAQCLEYALKANDREGFWGGFSARQRKDLRPLWLRGVPVTVLVDDEQRASCRT